MKSYRPELVRPTPELLEGRTAKCVYCTRTQPSDPGLAFFEYMGPHAQDRCDRCGYAMCTHALSMPDGMNPSVGRPCHITDHEFTNAEGRTVDAYYCGCYGWD